MKLRKLKHRTLSRLAPIVWDRYWQRQIDIAMEEIFKLTPEEEKAQQERFNAMWRDLFEKHDLAALVEPAPEPQKVYTVAKKSTGEIVGTYQDLGDAEEAVLKAQRQKKAALVITNL